jgi:integrase
MKGYFRKRGDKWSFTVDIGRDPATGKRKQKSQSGFKTKKAAQLACAELIADIEKNGIVQETNQTLPQLIEDWLEIYAKNNVRETTFKRYRNRADTRIIPYFKSVKVKDVTPRMVQQYIEWLKAEGIGHNYIKALLQLLKSSLDKAVEWNQIKRNPVHFVEKPKKPKQTVQAWDIDQVKTFVSHAKMENVFYYMVTLTLIHTGMRKGEALGLHWKDIDFENKKISVSRTLVQVDGEYVFNEPKTPTSKRQISVDDELISELKRYKAMRNEWKLALGLDSELVFCHYDGRPLNPRRLGVFFANVTKKAGLPKIKIHDLRHTHASILLKLGEHPKVVSERLGHSTIRTTLDIYSHVTPDMQENTATKFGQALQ